MTEKFIQTEVKDGIGFLTFNRPKALNAFNNEMMYERMSAMDRFSTDDGVKAVIVQGAGRAFSAGFDLKASAERNLDGVDKIRAQMALQFDFIIKFWDCPKPTIAVAQGWLASTPPSTYCVPLISTGAKYVGAAEVARPACQTAQSELPSLGRPPAAGAG